MYTKIQVYMSTANGTGRFANWIFQCFAVSKIAEKHNLRILNLFGYEKINQLGIVLYKGGTKQHLKTVNLNNGNFFDILNADKIDYNVNAADFFQTKEISFLLYQSLRDQKQTIMDRNLFHYRYDKNNDIFIHVRLTDATKYNPGVKYYLNAIERIKMDEDTHIYIASDDLGHPIITKIRTLYKHRIVLPVKLDDIQTIQFGSTCKNLILSHGSYSALIGYLGFYTENVFYSSFDGLVSWHGDMFSIPGWIMVERT
jgi:hypothetical protein